LIGLPERVSRGLFRSGNLMAEKDCGMGKASLGLVALVGLVAYGGPGFAEIPSAGEGLDGIYAGSYLCKDGEHGVVLDLAFAERASGEGLVVSGTLGIVPVLAGMDGEVGDVAGSFTVEGLLSENLRLDFRFGEWVVEPEGYGSANFRGALSQRADGLWQITGKPLAGAESELCSDMIATRILP